MRRDTRARRGIALAAASALMMLTIPMAAVAAIPGNPFTIDGKVPDGTAQVFEDPYGSVKELGPINGSQNQLGDIHLSPKPMLGLEATNGQVDLRRVWLDSKKSTTSGDIWLYLGWERDANTGSGFIMYEFQQAPVPAGCDYSQPTASLIASCNPFENRQPGDFILVWDQTGSANTIGVRYWTYSDANGNGTWDKATEPLVLGPMTTLTGSTNAEATLSQDKFFGEAAVNLSKTIFATVHDQCLTIGNVIPGTVTGNSDTADYKDVVLADFSSKLTLSSCGSLAVTKVVDPATSTVPGSFTYTVVRSDGSDLRYALDGYSGAALKQVTDTIAGAGPFPHNPQVDLREGTNYALTEAVTGPYDWVSTSCSVGGKTYVGTAFPIVVGETTNCTITNKLQQGTLKVVKQVVNDNGGTRTVADFHASIDGAAPVAFTSTSADNLNGAYSVKVLPGTYKVTEPEADKDGYATTYGDTCAAVTVPAGGEGVCTITNNDKPAHLTLVKEVTNDNGGTLKASEWTLSATGGTTISGPGGVSSDVNAGTYALGESGPAGYAAGDWVCTGDGTQSGSNITLGVGQAATCTIVNNDKPADLTLVKKVENNYGGTALPEAWTLTAAGPTPLSGKSGTTATVNAGTYTLGEAGGPDGYTMVGWNCTGGVLKGDQLTLGLGESATCTVTNQDVPAQLTLVKEVVNDNGGTLAAADWTLSASGPTPLSGAGGVAATVVRAGTYSLSEEASAGSTGREGYTAGDWSCVGGTQAGADVTLKLGESAVCTIVNNDKPVNLTLVKNVINDNGGLAKAGDWTLTASKDGAAVVQGTTGVAKEISAGTYALAESDIAGYDMVGWECTAGTLDGANLTLALGDSATCTVTNDDKPVKLALVKRVVNDNGGTAEATAWTLSASGPTPLSGAGGVAETVVAQGQYTLSETGPGGYTPSTWSCVGGTQSGDKVTLSLGESAVCTITNDDDKASPSGETTQSWVLHDSLTIKGLRAGGGDATATFQLFSDASCTVQVGAEEVGTVGTLAATTKGVAVDQPGTYYWTVTYSGNTFNNGFTTACGSETTTITAKDAARP